MAGEFDGITVDGEKSVEEFLTDDFSKDVLEAKQEHIHPKRRDKVKYMEHKEKNGPVTTTPQTELNLTNLQNNIFKYGTTKIHIVLMYLLASHELTAKSLVEYGITKHATSAAGYFRRIKQSNLKMYMKKSGTARTGYSYMFSSEGRNLKPAAALTELNTAIPKVGKHSPTSDPVPHKFPLLTLDPNDPTMVKNVIINVTLKVKLEVV